MATLVQTVHLCKLSSSTKLQKSICSPLSWLGLYLDFFPPANLHKQTCLWMCEIHQYYTQKKSILSTTPLPVRDHVRVYTAICHTQSVSSASVWSCMYHGMDKLWDPHVLFNTHRAIYSPSTWQKVRYGYLNYQNTFCLHILPPHSVNSSCASMIKNGKVWEESLRYRTLNH